MVVVSEKPRSTIAPLAAGASVLGICCGLPLLASAGVLGAVAGIGLGSWLIVALAVVVGVVGLVRWRRTRDSYPAPRLDDTPLAAVHDTVLSSTRPSRSDEESR